MSLGRFLRARGWALLGYPVCIAAMFGLSGAQRLVGGVGLLLLALFDLWFLLVLAKRVPDSDGE
jgi:hypothetical protein